MKEYFKKYIFTNRQSIITLSICLGIGFLMGMISYSFLSIENKTIIIDSIRKTLDLSKQENFEGLSILRNAFESNFVLIFIIVLSSMLIIAPAALCIIYFLKGFSIGLYIVLIINIFGFLKGILIVILAVILPNFVYLPTFIYLGVNAISFHYDTLKKDYSKYRLGRFIKYGYQTVSVFPFFLLSVIIENLTVSTIFNIYKSII